MTERGGQGRPAATLRKGVLGLGALLGTLATPLTVQPPRAEAQPAVLVDVEGAVAGPIASPQFDRFGWGARLAVGARMPITAWLVPTLRLHGLVLGDGPRPPDASLADPGVGWLARLALGLRLRAHGFLEPDRLRRGDGAWVELALGAAVTGALVRPTFEVALGWAFAVGDVDLGPLLRLEHVVHFADPLDQSGAVLLSIGMEAVFLDVVPPPEPEVEVEEAPTDRDGDGIAEPLDACPDVPEDLDGDRDDDGCPEDDADRDGDGIVDRLDACPDEAEDVDGYDDADGCPDLDDDSDGIFDASDHCPRDPEIINGVDDEDGCPDEGLITMVDDRIVLDERVLFELNRARVRHAARPILAAIVELWRQHPEWRRVRIEGHADERGTSEYNLELSTHRAERVRDELVELGMPADIFEAVGYGATRPRDTRGTEEAMEANRRVEFVVLESHPAEAAP